jgi:hypothetical protein
MLVIKKSDQNHFDPQLMKAKLFGPQGRFCCPADAPTFSLRTVLKHQRLTSSNKGTENTWIGLRNLHEVLTHTGSQKSA